LASTRVLTSGPGDATASAQREELLLELAAGDHLNGVIEDQGPQRFGAPTSLPSAQHVPDRSHIEEAEHLRPVPGAFDAPFVDDRGEVDERPRHGRAGDPLVLRPLLGVEASRAMNVDAVPDMTRGCGHVDRGAGSRPEIPQRRR